MILSHRHRFIFIKTTKTAGTSMEVALSCHCGPRDIITPVSPEDERLRRQWGGQGPQHHLKPWSDYCLQDWWRLLRKRRRRARFYNHMSAGEIQSRVPETIWQDYFKFCFERNPWDRVISYYHWYRRRRGEPFPDLIRFIHSDALYKLKATGWGLYTQDGRVVVDRIYPFEAMDSALEEIGRRLGLDAPLQLPRAKAGIRRDRRSYRELLSPRERDRIADVFRDEIERMGYRF